MNRPISTRCAPARAWAAGVTLAALLVAGCAPRATSVAATRHPAPIDGAPAPLGTEPGRLVTVVHGAFGCQFELSIAGVAEADARRLADEAVGEIDRCEDALGGWRDDTDLARLNREAAAGPVPASPRLLDAIERALALNRATGGAFDVTVGPLVDAYGFRGGAPRLPPPDELERLAASVGPGRLRLDAAAGTIAFDRAGVAVDLDGLNKGIAVDRVLDLLRAAGVTDASLSAGGSTIGSIGPPPPRAARTVAIAGPDGEVHARVELRDAVLSTSGNWRQAFELDGRTYGPIFDPRTGRPVDNEVLSATAIAPRGDESEAYAKAAVVAGREESRRFVEARPDIGLVLLIGRPDGHGPVEIELWGAAAREP